MDREQRQRHLLALVRRLGPGRDAAATAREVRRVVGTTLLLPGESEEAFLGQLATLAREVADGLHPVGRPTAGNGVPAWTSRGQY
jgi:hypothetical protein